MFSRHKGNKAIWLEYNGDLNGNNIPDLDEIAVIGSEEKSLGAAVLERIRAIEVG